MLKTSGQFDERGLAHVDETLNLYLAGESEALWFTADDGEPVGVAYCAPEPVTDGTWNLLMLWTRQDRSGQGHGTALVGQVERALSEQGARLLIIETSGLPDFETARGFYSKCGFTQEARIREFFAAGDDKIIFTKRLASNDNAA
ncbi:MAG: GNAT family N-acetyltransferase [Acidobacteriota bacterium]|nr:GNAT family N-acetyltransferase [Acidobacteriota bacterium]